MNSNAERVIDLDEGTTMMSVRCNALGLIVNIFHHVSDFSRFPEVLYRSKKYVWLRNYHTQVMGKQDLTVMFQILAS